MSTHARLSFRLLAAPALAALSSCAAPDAVELPLDSSEAAAEGWTIQTLSTPIESPHPYADTTRIEERIEAPAGAAAIRVRLRVQTEKNFDFVEIATGGGDVVQRVSGRSDGWSREIPGDVAIVRLTSDESVTDFGFRVTAFQYRRDSAPISGAWTELQTGGIGTAHPYRNDTDQTWTVTAPPEATRVRLHFTGFETEADYDFAILLDGEGREVKRYSGTLGDFVSTEVPGNVARIRFTSDETVFARGFDVPRYEALIDAGGCRADADCRSGERCQPVTCVRAPCPNQCVPGMSGASAGPAERCSTSGPTCASGLVCRGEESSSSGGACAAPAWSREPAFPRSTRHPYADGEDLRFDIGGAFASWADRIRVIFDRFETEAGADIVRVFDGTRAAGEHSGELGRFTSAELSAAHASLVFTSDGQNVEYGFDVRTVEAYGAPSRLVAMSIDPRQCGSNAFPTDDSGLVSYLARQGVTVYGLRRYTFATLVCRACTCPTGERIVVLVAPRDADTVSRLSNHTSVFSVEQDAVVYTGALVELSATPKQCSSNVWDHYCQQAQDPACGSSVESRLRAWARSVGAPVLAFEERPVREAVCESCSCPTGSDVHVTVAAEQARALEAEGFVR